MSGAEGQELELPKGRTIPINGDKVRRLRIKNKFSIEVFAKLVNMSSDRLIEIERGGQNVFPLNFLAIAEALGLGKDWRPLHQGEPEGGLKAEPTEALQERRIKAALQFPDNSPFDLATLAASPELVSKLLQQCIELQYEVIVIAIKKGSIIVEVEMSEEDLLRLVAAFTKAGLDPIHVEAIRLPATTGPLAAGLLQIIEPTGTPAEEMTNPVTREMTLTRTPAKSPTFSVEKTNSAQKETNSTGRAFSNRFIAKCLGAAMAMSMATLAVAVFLLVSTNPTKVQKVLYQFVAGLAVFGIIGIIYMISLVWIHYKNRKT